MSEGLISESLLLREKRQTVIDDVYFKTMCGLLEHSKYSPRNNNLKKDEMHNITVASPMSVVGHRPGQSLDQLL